MASRAAELFIDFPENLSVLVLVTSWALEVLPRAVFAEALGANEIC
jgi:hypothetical protein